MRTISSIERSIKGHEKPIIALHKDGSIYKEFESTSKASKELGLKSNSSINNALKGRSKSAGGYIWIYKENYNPNNKYTYISKKLGTPVYQFDINGLLLNVYPSKRFIDRLEGWSLNGLNSAIRNKTLYHDTYWSESNSIDLDEFEQYFYYQELDPNGNIIEMYRTQIEICNKYNLNSGTVCTKIKNNELILPNGNTISKL